MAGSKKVSEAAIAAPMPAFVEPCLAKTASATPEGTNWVHEVKFDGYRLQARIESANIQLLTRAGLDWTDKFGPIRHGLSTLKAKSAIIDGEAIVEDKRGASDFTLLQSALKSKRPERIVFVAFDLLYIDGQDMRTLSLEERKARLKAILATADQEQLRYSEHLTGDGSAIFREVSKLGLEGIVSKRLDKPYRSGRQGDWLKTKATTVDEFLILGFTLHSATKSRIGSLALGYWEGGDLKYAGRVGTGFDERTGHDLWREVQPLSRPSSLLTVQPDRSHTKGVMWIEPNLVAVIEYRGWSSDGLLRHAAFKALRHDKPASQIVRPK